MSPRKIIHIDMDCFYAAVEVRDNPHLKGNPVAVGGPDNSRSVICSANYEARKYGVRAAMASSTALRLCPQLVMVPVNMPKYKHVSHGILDIFQRYTPLVEPLSLDEAYLDVTQCSLHQGSATLIAKAIREEIFQEHKVTASAGIAPNKFLAKIASGWNKPNNQFVIAPPDIAQFIAKLPVEELWGVGAKTTKKMHQLGLITCEDIQKISEVTLVKYFGRLGHMLYQFSRGHDDRRVNPNRITKSVSAETTFTNDREDIAQCRQEIASLFNRLQQRLERHNDRKIKSQFIKLKFHDFSLTTMARSSTTLDIDLFQILCTKAYVRYQKPIRLIGLGVDFVEHHTFGQQLSLF